MKHSYVAFSGLGAVLLLLNQPAHAYLDPGTGSMILQGLIAAVAGVMVTARMYWHKIKSFFGRGSAPTESRDQDDSNG